MAREVILSAVRLLIVAAWRRQWRSWLAIAALVSVVGGIVLAATAGGRRTDSAFPEFVATHGFDAVVYAAQPVRANDFAARDPAVTSVVALVSADNGRPTCDCAHPINPNDFGVSVLPPNGRSLFKLVSGRLPDPSSSNEVLASFTLQQDYGLKLGSVVHVPFFASSQAAAYLSTPTALLRPEGPTVAFRVVGFEATENEFPSGGTPFYDLYATESFAHEVVPQTAVSYLYFVHLRHGAADLPRFNSALNTAGVEGYQNMDTPAAAVEASVHPQAIGWWLLAALAALVGLAVTGQALARQSIAESEHYPTILALGASRRQLVALGLARNVAVGLAGAVGAVVVATMLSPIAPLGEARLAEPSTGVSFDTLVLLLGALATVVVVVTLGMWPALRATHAFHHGARSLPAGASPVVGAFASAGAPPSAVIGVRNALEGRSSGSSVPVGSAVLGTVLAVVALCGTAVFGASLSNLTATPRLYGAPFQLNFTNPGGGIQPDSSLLQSLTHDKAVTAVTEGIAVAEVSINKVAVSAIAGTAIRGRLLLSTVSGHVPSGDGEIGLGAATMRQVGARAGSVVRVVMSLPSGGRRTVPFRVVAQISFPVLGGGIVSLGRGAVFTIAGYEDAICPPGQKQALCRRSVAATSAGGGLLASVVAGPKGQAAINHYLDTYGSSAALAITPTSLVNFGEAVNFPLIFGVMLGLFGIATLVHLLFVSVSRRRREIGLLKVLGFVNAQVGSAVAWQATTLALIGIVVGVPVGVFVGRAVWKAFADNLGVVPVCVVPIWLTGVLAAGVVVVANFIAVVPALVATRAKPGELLWTQ